MTTASGKSSQPSRPDRSSTEAPEQRAARRRDVELLLGNIGRLWIAYARGQLVLMLVVGVLTWLGMLALGVRGALWLGGVAGALEAVPNLGPLLSTAVGAVVALRYGSSYLPLSPVAVAVLVTVFYVLLQLAENYLLVPRVMGDAVKLPALVVLAGILIGGAVAGVPGAVLATPLIATVRELWRFRRIMNRKARAEPKEE